MYGICIKVQWIFSLLFIFLIHNLHFEKNTFEVLYLLAVSVHFYKAKNRTVVIIFKILVHFIIAKVVIFNMFPLQAVCKPCSVLGTNIAYESIWEYHKCSLSSSLSFSQMSGCRHTRQARLFFMMSLRLKFSCWPRYSLWVMVKNLNLASDMSRFSITVILI